MTEFEQIWMFTRELRDQGIALAADAEDGEAPGWSDGAYAAIVRIAQRQPTVHVDDVLREYHRQPHHHNAWGAVWIKAIRQDVIEATGKTCPCMTDPTKHGHKYPIYRSKLYGVVLDGH